MMDGERRLSMKEAAFVEALPAYNWDVIAAGLAVGWSEMYVRKQLHSRCKNNVGLRRRIEAKRREISGKTWSVEKWRAEVADALRRCRETGDRTNELALLKMIGMHIGAFEKDNQQRAPRIGMVII